MLWPLKINFSPYELRLFQAHKHYHRHWVLLSPYSYSDLWISDRREYYAMVLNEWAQCMNKSNILIKELSALHAPLPCCHSFKMPWNNLHEYIAAVLQIQDENNRMVMHKAWFFLLSIMQENANNNGRELSSIEYNALLQNPNYVSDYSMSDEA